MPLIAVVVLVVAVTTLFTLFVRPSDIPPPEPVSPARHLEDRKAVIYENLRDLQFEYRVGKLSDADYQQTKLTLQKELAGVMAEIDRIAQVTPSKTAPGRIPPEKPKAAVSPVAKSTAAAISPSGRVVENTCPHCGAKFPNSMKFCGECGKAMG
jgi:hypothetical protein